MDDTSEMGTGDSGVESIASNDVIMNVRLSIPELNLQMTLQFHPEDAVWKAKQQLLSSFAKDLKDGFNYGFYFPPMNGRAGKFLDEERLLKEYSFNASSSSSSSSCCLEFKMKRKVYKSMNITIKKAKQLHSKGNLKQFMEYVRRGESDKIMKLLNKGMDPNFIESDSGETPLTLACVTIKPSSVVVALVGGGAHLDFRNKKGLTPLHVATQTGNEEAIKILLDLGSSTNYKDMRGLTPLYHGSCNDVTARCIEMLLFDHATLDNTDEHGWTELHQSCKGGRIQHVELLIYYGADLNRQNCSGNTPLHISVINDQEECVRTLMFRGSTKSILNHANKDALQCAIISGNTRLARIIQDFSSSEAVPYQDAPRYNAKRRSVHHFQSVVGTLKRCRSNPLISSSTEYETIDDAKLSSQCSLWDQQHLIGGRSQRRSTALPDLSTFNEQQPLQSRPLHSISTNSNQSFSSADSSQAEGEIILEQKKLEDLKSKIPGTRHVLLSTDSTDYGFILRGIKANRMIVSRMDHLISSSVQPGLQYFEHVKPNSLADKAGIKPGDFLLEVNGVDVTLASHEYAVSLIRNSVHTLQMLITTPQHNSIYRRDSIDSKKRSILTSKDLTSKELKNSLSFKTFPVPSESTFTDQKVASIRSVHGKRLACNLPGDDPDRVRVVSVPLYNSNSISRRFLWKAKSVQNISEGNDICFMFGDDNKNTSNPYVTKEPTIFGIFGTSHKDKNNVKKSEKHPLKETYLTNHVEGFSCSSEHEYNRFEQTLSSFATLSNQNSFEPGIKSDTKMQSKCLGTQEYLTTLPPRNNFHNTPVDEHVSIQKHQDKHQDFFILAENARQVFLTHQKTPITVDGDDILKLNQISGGNIGDDPSSLKNRYVMEPHVMYNTTREISKLALVSNRRHIFEGNINKQNIESNQTTETCIVVKNQNEEVIADRWRKKYPLPPKPLQKPSNLFQNNIQRIPNYLQTNPKPSQSYNSTAHFTDFHRTNDLPSLPEPNRLMNVSFTSEDSEIFSIPPPPGFEDENTSSCSKLNKDVHHYSNKSGHPGKNTKLKESMEVWTLDDVGDWLDLMGLGEHRGAFLKNNVNGKKLSTLGRNDLISLGVLQVGQRMGLERAVKKILISYSSS